jgi:vesicle-fusing ATPase
MIPTQFMNPLQRPKQKRRRWPSTTTTTTTTTIRQSPITAPNEEPTTTVDADTTMTNNDTSLQQNTITITYDTSKEDIEEGIISSAPIPMSTTAWDILGGNVGTCLVASDLKRDSGFDGSSTGWVSWVEESSAYRLQQCIDRLVFCGDNNNVDNENENDTINNSKNRDDTLRWLKWMKASPAPMIVELSNELRLAVNDALTEKDYERVGQSRTEFLSRIGCRFILLPSGTSLKDNLRTAPGAMVYGKLCYGGVTRYRMLGTGGGIGANNNHIKIPRKAGERTTIVPNDAKSRVEGWLQYGGPERNYDAIDMGPCGLMEITILPKGLTLGLLSGGRQVYDSGQSHKTTKLLSNDDKDDDDDDDDAAVEKFVVTPKNAKRQPTEEMVVTQATTSFDPQWLFSFPLEEEKKNYTTTIVRDNDDSLYEYYGVDDIERKFSTVLGGLQNEIQSIIRRVLDGRQRTTSSDSDDNTSSSSSSSELQTMLDLGLSPVRGLLLYGKPGTGKTALAREISRLLTDRPPKIIAAPELLDRWVGGTESCVRELFIDAEAELAMCNGDPTLSGLHVIVIDEIDAVFRKRSSSSGSGEVARASAVNQILSKLDGMKSLGNVLVIGTTNRRELLDEALLRPGRLEVKIEVPLPDHEGRREILKIYFGPLRSMGRLSQPLCSAIDGSSSIDRSSSNSGTSSSSDRIRIRMLKSLKGLVASPGKMVMRDLASDRWTGGFSGADLEGLVRCAGSIALSRARNDGSGVDGLLITTEDVNQALQEVKQ